jgi:hypothetical protein
MRNVQIPLPELALIAGTRVALGVGIGLLIADTLAHAQRRAAGWTLIAVGALSTIPLAADVFSRRASHHHYHELPIDPTAGGPPGSRPWLFNSAAAG